MKPSDCISRSIELISHEIVESEYFIAFTGAGISTESGIPDYRSKGGIWDKFRPVYIDEFMSSRDARVKDPSRNNFRVLHLIFRSSLAVPQSRDPQRRITTLGGFAQSITTKSNLNLSGYHRNLFPDES